MTSDKQSNRRRIEVESKCNHRIILTGISESVYKSAGRFTVVKRMSDRAGVIESRVVGGLVAVVNLRILGLAAFWM